MNRGNLVDATQLKPLQLCNSEDDGALQTPRVDTHSMIA